MEVTSAAVTKEIRRLIGGARIFGCKFTKADGTIRTGSFRLKVRKNLTGAGPSYNTDDRGNIIAYDMNKKGYRTIPLRRVEYFNIRGVRVEI